MDGGRQFAERDNRDGRWMQFLMTSWASSRSIRLIGQFTTCYIIVHIYLYTYIYFLLKEHGYSMECSGHTLSLVVGALTLLGSERQGEGEGGGLEVYVNKRA